MRLPVFDEAGADIRIEGDHPFFVLPRHQRLIGGAAGLGNEADRAEMQRLAEISERRKVLRSDHPPGRVLVEEGVTRMPVDELHEGKRRVQRQRGAGSEIDIRGLERRAQDVSEHIVRKAGEKACGDAEPAERDGRVEDRAARIGRKGALARRRLPRQHVDQGLSAANDHVHSSPNIFNRSGKSRQALRYWTASALTPPFRPDQSSGALRKASTSFSVFSSNSASSRATASTLRQVAM